MPCSSGGVGWRLRRSRVEWKCVSLSKSFFDGEAVGVKAIGGRKAGREEEVRRVKNFRPRKYLSR